MSALLTKNSYVAAKPLAVVGPHVEEVHLHLAGPVHQWHEHLGRPPPQLAQVGSDRRHSDLEAFLDQLPVQPRSRDPLLGRRPRPPLIEQYCDSRPHRGVVDRIA
jgi:hypothetical protein